MPDRRIICRIREQDFPRNDSLRIIRIEVLEHAAHVSGGVEILGLFQYEASLTPNSAGPHVEDLHAQFKGILDDRDEIGIRAVTKDDCIALRRPG